jgi:rubrerythrin
MAESINDLTVAWRRAVQAEEESHAFYKAMATKATDPSVERFFNDLAAEEQKHKERLLNEYQRTFQKDLG